MVKTLPFQLSRPNAKLPEATLAAGIGGVLLYLGFREGGYEPIVFGATAATLWWLLGVGLIFGLLPARRPGRASIALLGTLLALTALTALSLAWTLSPERTMAEAVRVAGLLALAALVVLMPARRAETIPAAVAAVGVIVAIAALVTRFEPGLGGPADDVVAFLPTTLARLSFPLGYWNSLGALMAMTIPLLLTLASGEGARVARALAAGAVPAVVLVGFYTLSRGALLALIAALVLLIALHPRRTVLLQTVALAAVGSSILIWAADRRGELADGLLTPTAESQGSEMALIAVAVVAVVSLGHGVRRGRLLRIRPIGRRPSRRVAGAAGAVIVALAIGAAAVADAPEAVSERWDQFKDAGSAPTGTSRLGAAGGRGRYQWWDAAVDAGLERPLSGIGPGTYEFRWSEAGTLPDPVRDAHSLYLESFAELGLPGFLLIVALVGGSIVGGAIITRRAPPEDRATLASMVAACGAFAASAAVDWSWEMTVLPAAFIVLAAGVAGHKPTAVERRPHLRLPVRGALGATAVLVALATTVPTASVALLESSREHATRGELQSAFDDASGAASLAPWAASPRLQQGLILEEAGALALATEYTKRAIERESANWQNWLTLARIEAKRDRLRAATAAFEEAEQRNPRSGLFDAPVTSLATGGDSSG